MLKKKDFIDELLRLKDPDFIFDMVCMRNYTMGQFGANMPVDESRRIFKRIKELLKPTKKGNKG